MRPDDELYEVEWTFSRLKYDFIVPDPQDYLDMILRSRFFQGNWPKVKGPIKIRYWKNRFAEARLNGDGQDEIFLCPWGKTAHTLLHELSHFCEPVKWDSKAGDWTDPHDERFAQAELKLVRHYIGKDAGNCLYHLFKAIGRI